jgi:hypothetical protein
MSNDTPRTDAAEFEALVQDSVRVMKERVVFSEHARTLERELAALRERLDEAERENTALRAMQVGVKCAYGYKNADGVCALGYPGCACMDDLCATMEWGPDDLHAQANRRLLERATQAERERDEARKDAGLYQFLRDDDNWCDDGPLTWEALGELSGAEFDAFVDAKRAERDAAREGK